MCQWSSRVWAAQQLMSEESVNTNNLTSYKPNLMWGALQAVVSNRTIYRREGKKTSGSCAGVCTHARWHEAGEVKGCPGESSRLHFTMQLSWFWLKTPELNKKNPALTRRFAGMERTFRTGPASGKRAFGSWYRWEWGELHSFDEQEIARELLRFKDLSWVPMSFHEACQAPGWQHLTSIKNNKLLLARRKNKN